MGGFSKPILHGLCTFGFATRAIVSKVCDGDKDGIREIKVRFVKPVIPGQHIDTHMWVFPHQSKSQAPPTQQNNEQTYYVVFQTVCKETNTPVLIGNCIVTGLAKSPEVITTPAKL